MQALAALLAEHRAGNIIMFRSLVVLREVVKTPDQTIKELLLSDYNDLPNIALDEKVLGMDTQTDRLGGTTVNPIVSDVQDERVLSMLIKQGIGSRKMGQKAWDAEHIAQALANNCDVFLTRDNKTIIKPHRKWLEAQFPQLKVRLPTELLAELRSPKR
jgi:hypothetical protein